MQETSRMGIYGERESAGSLASQWPPSDPAGSSLDAAVGLFLPFAGSPLFAEYEYRKGTVLLRLSHYLTPHQAAEYKRALTAS